MLQFQSSHKQLQLRTTCIAGGSGKDAPAFVFSCYPCWLSSCIASSLLCLAASLQKEAKGGEEMPTRPMHSKRYCLSLHLLPKLQMMQNLNSGVGV